MTPTLPVIPPRSDNAHNFCRRPFRAEKYLGRQIMVAHNLALPVLERYYLADFLALQLWLMTHMEDRP